MRPFGDFLHDLRLEKNLTLRQAGNELGISFVYISEIEAGKRIPSEKILKLFSRFYSIPLGELTKLVNDQKLIQSSRKSLNSHRLEVARSILEMPENEFDEISKTILNIKKGDAR